MLRTLCFIIGLGGALAVGACRKSAPTPVEDTPVKRYGVASVYPMAELARQVAGDRIEIVWDIQWLCENGQDPRDFHPTDDQARQIRRCDAVFTSGFPDAWAGEMLNDDQRLRQLVDPSATAAGRAYSGAHGALWLDINVARQFVEQARERLSINDPKHAASYRDAAARVSKQLDVLESEYQAKLGPLWGRKFLSLRRTWQPMVQRFGLQEIAPIDAEPGTLSDAEAKTLKQTASQNGIGFLAVDASLLPGVQRELQLRTGLKLLPLDLVGTSAPDGNSTYLRLMRYNLSQLVGCGW